MHGLLRRRSPQTDSQKRSHAIAQASYLKIILKWAGVILFVVIGSWVVMGLWGGPVEKSPASAGPLVIEERMTLKAFGRANRLPDKIVQKAFSLKSADGLAQTIQATALSSAEITDRINKALAFAAEEGSKNWVKIAAKFASWAAVLLAIFFLLKNARSPPFCENASCFSPSCSSALSWVRIRARWAP